MIKIRDRTGTDALSNVVEKLLQMKASVNTLPFRRYGRTALRAAAGEGYLHVVEILLAANADTSANPAITLDQ
jgi:ankyrin repeat protein